MRFIHTDRGPAAVGPYSQAVEAEGWVYVSGQVALEPGTGKLLGDDAESQARQAMKNLGAILEEAGCRPRDVVRCTVYLLTMDDFEAVNRIYAEFFGDHRPARACVAVSQLPKAARVEVDATARRP